MPDRPEQPLTSFSLAAPRQRPLRIAVDGAQSTGKTTLIEQLATHYENQFSYIPEAARQVALEFGVQNADDWPALLNDRDQLREFFSEEERWLIAKEKCGSFIVDSSWLLIQAYREYWECPRDRSLLTRARYDLVLYCPPTNAFVEDGFRFCQGRLEVDQIYRRIAKQSLDGKLVTLPCAEPRLPFAIRAIDRLVAAK